MASKSKKIVFPTFNVSDSKAIEIVKYGLQDNTIPPQTRLLAISRVAEMPTHNSVTKQELITALRWIFECYDFEED